jgi:uncharacterized membrane protein YfcA
LTFSVGAHAVAGLAAAAAGCVNAIAGGGTLISFPALVAVGATTIEANTTNTVALCPGYFGGAWAQRQHLGGDRARLVRLSIAAGLGGLTGSLVLIATGDAVFSRVVPFLILLACALLASQNRLRRAIVASQQRRGVAEGHPLVPVVVTFVMSIYGGYFGAGLGIIFLAVLGVILEDPLPRINALRQVLALSVNVVAAVFFAATGNVLWSLALVMAVAALAGGVAGGKLVGIIPPNTLRAIIVVYGVTIAGWYFVR